MGHLAVASHELAYDLETTPPASLYSVSDLKESPSHSPRISIHTDINVSTASPPQPSYRLLFSLLTVRQRLCLFFPAVLFSMTAGGIAPFMTFVIGIAFQAFARFPISSPSPADKERLMHDVGIAALELVGLAVGSVALGSLTSWFWIWTGEYNTMAIRKRVYDSVAGKEMEWFDTKMGSEGAGQAQDDASPVGAGGLMAKFTGETDDVRKASSLAMGMLVQYVVTVITCLALAFTRSWQLTFVVLAALPIIVLLQGLSQTLAAPRIAVERRQAAVAGTLLDRLLAAIATVKAFNAAPQEASALRSVFGSMLAADTHTNKVWAVVTVFSHFTMMAMFVQGFWYGGKLVRDGRVSPGDVMAVFWACLIAASNLQMCIPQLILISRGKQAFASLFAITLEDSTSFITPSHPKTFHLRKITPARCVGEMSLFDVTFAYPSRPTVPVLKDVSLYLPSGEMTFIVGGSGSGKSTIAQLLQRMYLPQSGNVQLDSQDITFLDELWTRAHVSSLSQSCIIFDMNVHDNIAIGLAGVNGRSPADATPQEIEEACVSAYMSDFINDLPDGYLTPLGTGGATISGGQKQRLAIARAMLRDPTILILDEATSALDPTSRLLVFSAIRAWRENKTTVVITHDLSQVQDGDFSYVLKEGVIVEQGFRRDLQNGHGEFQRLLEIQGMTGGFLPVKEVQEPEGPSVASILVEHDIDGTDEEVKTDPRIKRATLMPDLWTDRRVTGGNWMIDAVSDLAARPTPAQLDQMQEKKQSEKYTELPVHRPRRPSSVFITPAVPKPPALVIPPSGRRHSLQFTPTSGTFSFHSVPSIDGTLNESGEDLIESHRAAMLSGTTRSSVRRPVQTVRKQWNGEGEKKRVSPKPSAPIIPLGQLARDIWPLVPSKPLLFFGLFLCVCSGAVTPLFSFFLSRLLVEISAGAQDISIINTFGAVVLGIAALDGIFMGSKYFVMQLCGMRWITDMRSQAVSRVLAQDKKWFDKSENSPAYLVQSFLKDADDAKPMISVVIGQAVVVTVMLLVGLIWAMVQSWQLTLCGIALAPVFATTMAVQGRLIAKCEIRNKRAREDIAQNYYQTLSNIRGIRAMTLDGIFRLRFHDSTDKALTTGVQGAFVEGCTYGVASGLIYLSEALLFFVGAVLVSRSMYTYLEVVQALNLVVFTVTIASQLLAFAAKIHNAINGTRDLHRLLNLSTDCDETKGVLCGPMEGAVVFSHINFSYPTRPDVPVLQDLNFSIKQGESVAIVGTSGSGKSTIASLLQRLYEPTSGTITIGFDYLASTSVTHLRRHVSVVSQYPHLFDASISDNIKYGDKAISDVDVRRAARAANIHEFIMGLPQGYETHVGENGTLISGGQAQRLCIARALARPANVVILDECTSALDAENQATVLDAIRSVQGGRTVVMVTHKLQVMQMCDRILVVHDGRVEEEGTFGELMDRKGVFASLASGGEWVD